MAHHLEQEGDVGNALSPPSGGAACVGFSPGRGARDQSSSPASSSCASGRERSSGASGGRRTGSPPGCSGSGCSPGCTCTLWTQPPAAMSLPGCQCSWHLLLIGHYSGHRGVWSIRQRASGEGHPPGGIPMRRAWTPPHPQEVLGHLPPTFRGPWAPRQETLMTCSLRQPPPSKLPVLTSPVWPAPQTLFRWLQAGWPAPCPHPSLLCSRLRTNRTGGIETVSAKGR